MFRKMLSYFALPLLLFFLSNSSGNSAPEAAQTAPGGVVPGPDVITGEMCDLYQSGFEAPAEVGLSISNNLVQSRKRHGALCSDAQHEPSSCCAKPLSNERWGRQ